MNRELDYVKVREIGSLEFGFFTNWIGWDLVIEVIAADRNKSTVKKIGEAYSLLGAKQVLEQELTRGFMVFSQNA